MKCAHPMIHVPHHCLPSTYFTYSAVIAGGVWHLLAFRIHHQPSTLFCPLKSCPSPVCFHHQSAVTTAAIYGICMLAFAPLPAKSHTKPSWRAKGNKARHHGGPEAIQHKLADAEQCIVPYQRHVLLSVECVQRACASSTTNPVCPHVQCTPACYLVFFLS